LFYFLKNKNNKKNEILNRKSQQNKKKVHLAVTEGTTIN
jgi:hypothetical protein